MSRSNFLIAIILCGVIFAVIFMRDSVRAIFTNSPSVEAVLRAEDAYKQAVEATVKAEDAVRLAELDLEAKKETLNERMQEEADAEERLAEVEANPEKIVALRAEITEPPKFIVEAVRSTEAPLQSALVLSGTTEAGRRVNAVAETSGQVVSPKIGAGTSVVAGDVLCAIETGTRGAQLQQAEAAISSAETQLRVNERLFERGLGSEAAVKSARANYDQARAALAQVTNDIKNLEIKAPFDGKLENDTAETGTFLSPGGLCATVISLEKVKLVAYAAESQVPSLRLGANVMAQVSNIAEPLSGKVSSISTTADSVTRAYRVEVEIDETDQEVLDGTSAVIGFEIAGQTGHRIPQNAISLSPTGEIGVMIYNEGKAEFMPVQIASDTSQGLWVTGLPAEVNLIIEGHEFVTDGQEIEAVISETAPNAATDGKDG